VILICVFLVKSILNLFPVFEIIGIREGITLTKLPKMVETVLNDYIRLFHKHLPETLEGLYLHGSIALNSFVDEFSDIDFITITKHRLSKEDSDVLTLIHKSIQHTYQKPELDGVYILKEDIGKMDPSSKDENEMYIYYNNGELNCGAYFNFNPITWYLFKYKGIRVLGPEISSYEIELSSEQMREYVLSNMNTYWAGRVLSLENSIDEVKNYPTSVIDNEVEWSILGVLRQYYTLKESSIISKQDAGTYGLQQLPEEWHGLIKEAMKIRHGVDVKSSYSVEERVKHTLEFLKYLICVCNNLKNDSYSEKNRRVRKVNGRII
jgi:hypothetical protein